MFHHATTLHHRHSQSYTMGKPSRMVHVNWFANAKLKSAVVWDYMVPLRKAARLYSWSFGWPIITKGFDMTMRGARKAIDGAEWTAHTAKEGALGVGQMTVSPIALLAYSRLVAIKRFLWDVPIATVSAAIRTPIAIAKSPFEMISGVRAAITSIPKNVGEIFNSMRDLNVMDTLRNTRKAITDVILPPIVKPVKPILTPAYNLVNTALGAELQTVSKARHAITDVIPSGARRIAAAPATASAVMAQKTAVRDAAKAALEQEKEAKKAALKAKIAEDKGEDVSAGQKGGGQKKAA